VRLPLPGKFLPVAHNVQPGEAFIGFPFLFSCGDCMFLFGSSDIWLDF
jgi:hypothetical protein